MRLLLRKLKSPRYGQRWRRQGMTYQFCCGRMEEAWEHGWIYPSEHGDELAVMFSEGYDDATEVLGIEHCPFCGEKIELDVKHD